ncbi:AAA family ATPase [Danxiaibacter flavus]|uniref:AAA family ATPase n=1 Tax=Danxiaibacter flavus TaxID=3049108 RepID=A0ABV3ZNU8_9BACT|nr:AAA family ATPase [Chitinophagaceae bacterium DXS]
MKIRHIQFDKHPVLGDLNVNFIDENGNSVNNIIIAGENGTGKSVLLSEIYEFTHLAITAIDSPTVITAEFEFSPIEMQSLQASNSAFAREGLTNILTIVKSCRPINNYEQIKIYGKTKDGSILLGDGTLVRRDTIILRSIYSDVEINFNPQSIKSVTNADVDRAHNGSQRSNSKLSTEIAQLLVDIQNSDAIEFTNWAKEHVGQPIDESKMNIRTRRFTNAFHSIFPNKRFVGIQNGEQGKKIVFEENGKTMTIEQLSSGEKQIVFRGSFLLKDYNLTKGAVVLVDEPETSLHPRWQLEIMNFFRKLFTTDEGVQTSQLIVTTHSPFVVHNSKRIEDKVIVLEKNNQGKIVAATDPKFFTWSNEKLIQKAFNLASILLDGKAVVFVEGETDEQYFNKCLEIFNKRDQSIKFSWIGKLNDRGQAENTGDNALNQAKSFFNANIDHATSKIILLYDSDTNKPEDANGNLLTRRMSKNDTNTIYKIGIENLLKVEEIPDFDLVRQGFYNTSNSTDEYGAPKSISTLNKRRLCDFVCDELGVEVQRKVFENINNEIDRLLSDIE